MRQLTLIWQRTLPSMDNTIEVQIPVSIGELFDKITILEIKKEKIVDKQKLKNIDYELSRLNTILSSLNLENNVNYNELKLYVYQLKVVNLLLWDIEEAKRNKEKLQEFNTIFIELSRSVYIKNDERALIKKKINLCTNSLIVEEKSYE